MPCQGHIAAQSEHPPIACSHGFKCLPGALDHGRGTSGAAGTGDVGHSQEHAMPKPYCRQATWAPRVSTPPSLGLIPPPTASIGRAWKCLWKACRGVAQALDHGGTSGAAGTGDIGHSQEHAMPKPHCRQATWWAPRVSTPPSLALAPPRIPRATASIGRAWNEVPPWPWKACPSVSAFRRIDCESGPALMPQPRAQGTGGLRLREQSDPSAQPGRTPLAHPWVGAVGPAL